VDFHPDDAYDLIAYLIVGLPAILGGVAAFYVQRRELKHQRGIQEKTLYEVKNDHRSNLRDDIDDLTSAVKEGFRDLTTDVAGLREELRTERIERIEGDRRSR